MKLHSRMLKWLLQYFRILVGSVQVEEGEYMGTYKAVGGGDWNKLHMFIWT